jgi:hypothetical protein
MENSQKNMLLLISPSPEKDRDSSSEDDEKIQTNKYIFNQILAKETGKGRRNSGKGLKKPSSRKGSIASDEIPFFNVQPTVPGVVRS